MCSKLISGWSELHRIVLGHCTIVKEIFEVKFWLLRANFSLFSSFSANMDYFGWYMPHKWSKSRNEHVFQKKNVFWPKIFFQIPDQKTVLNTFWQYSKVSSSRMAGSRNYFVHEKKLWKSLRQLVCLHIWRWSALSQTPISKEKSIRVKVPPPFFILRFSRNRL